MSCGLTTGERHGENLIKKGVERIVTWKLQKNQKVNKTMERRQDRDFTSRRFQDVK